MNETDTILIHPFYQTAQAQITEPTRFVTFSQYYRRRWLRIVGPVGTAILLELRGRCYNNPVTGERRDAVIMAQKDLAEAVGISVDTLQRQLGKPGKDDDPKANQALRKFVWGEERFERSGSGRIRQLENIYHVAMDDPIHPDDAERLTLLMLEYEQREQAEQERIRLGRKNIIPATSISNDLYDLPEPHSAVLRGNVASELAPEPQIAVEGHRKLRQGSPQFAALSEESLLFTTKEITSTTLNVREGINYVDTGAEEQPSSESNLHGRPVFEEARLRQVEGIVEELQDWGSERRHAQLLSICEQHGLSHLCRQALDATRQRLAKEQRRGVLEKPGAYYQRILISLLEGYQIFVPKADEDDANEVRRMARKSLGLDE